MFADVLTQLFEEIAGMIEQYFPTVETLYGVKWASVLIHKLQVNVTIPVHCQATVLSPGRM